MQAKDFKYHGHPNSYMASKLILVTLIMLSALSSFTQKQDISITAYYTGGEDADSFAVENSHTLYSAFAI